MSKGKEYFVVVVRDDKDSPWEIHFGDYDKAVAMEEGFECTQCGYKLSDTKLLSLSDDSQEVIDAAVVALNEGEL